MESATSNPTTIQRFEQAAGPLTAVLDRVPPERWDAASPCEAWTARDVVGHLIGTQRDFLAGHGPDVGDAPDLADPAAAWASHRASITPHLADEALMATEYDGHFGRTTIGETIQRFYIFDMVVHRWDVATAAGIDERLTDGELDQIEAGASSFGDALYMEGVCKPGVDAPDGADRQARVLAMLGRRD